MLYIAVEAIYPSLLVYRGDIDELSITLRSGTPINSSTEVDSNFIVVTHTATTHYFYPPSASCKCFSEVSAVPDFYTVKWDRSFVYLWNAFRDADNEGVLSFDRGLSDE